jgi:hypothetical protein
MDRRNFLRGAAALPLVPFAAPAIAAIPVPSRITRISCEAGDPGEAAYGIICGDGKSVKVLLDGVKQKCVTADSAEGWVKRPLMSPSGNIAVNLANSTIVYETAHGRVEIIVQDKHSSDYTVWNRDDGGSVRRVPSA